MATGALTGVVRDSSGRAVPWAACTATKSATNAARTVVSTTEGVYTAASLLPGEYRVDVSIPGFRSERRGGVRIATGETTRLDFSLTVGDVREQVTVNAGTPVLRSGLTRPLVPGGYLLVGHAESLTGIRHGLELVRPAVYRRSAAASLAA